MKYFRILGSMFGIYSELQSSSIFEPMFPKPVKKQKSSIKSCQFVDNMVKLRGRGFKPRYRQIYSGLDDHLKWRTSVIGPYPQWQAKEPQGR